MDKVVEVKIQVQSIVNWVSEDRMCIALRGFGFVYLSSGQTVYSKGDFVSVNLRLWEKTTDQGVKIKRFYVI